MLAIFCAALTGHSGYNLTSARIGRANGWALALLHGWETGIAAYSASRTLHNIVTDLMTGITTPKISLKCYRRTFRKRQKTYKGVGLSPAKSRRLRAVFKKGVKKVVIMGAVKNARDEVGRISRVRGLNLAPCDQVLLSLYPSG